MIFIFCEYNLRMKKYIVFREWAEKSGGEKAISLSVLHCYNDLKSAKKDYPGLHYIKYPKTIKESTLNENI